MSVSIHQDTYRQHVTPFSGQPPVAKPQPSMCCQIQMTCETDAVEVDPGIDENESWPNPVKNTLFDITPTHFSLSSLPGDLWLPEIHLVNIGDDALVLLVSQCRWYYVSHVARDFLNITKTHGLAVAMASARQECDDDVCAALVFELLTQGLLASNAFYEKVSFPRSNIIQAIALHVSHRCNFRCSYCYADGGSYKAESMDMDETTAMRAIDFLFRRSAAAPSVRINFFGGEPTLAMPLIRKIIPYAQRQAELTNKKLRLTMTTNGSLLDGETLEYLQRHKVGLLVSLDGPAIIHDKHRRLMDGSCSHAVVVDNINSASNLDAKVKLRATHSGTEDDIGAIYAYLNTLPVAGAFVYHRSNPGDGYYRTMIEQHQDLLTAEKDYLFRTSHIRINPFFKFMRQILSGEFVDRPCGAGLNYVAISPEGRIYPCHRFMYEEMFNLGSVHDSPLATGFCQTPDISLRPQCSSCWARHHCGGQCYRESLDLYGSLDVVDSMYCMHTQSLIEGAAILSWIARSTDSKHNGF